MITFLLYLDKDALRCLSLPFPGRKFDSVSFLYVSKMDRPDPMREGHIPETVFYHPAAEGGNLPLGVIQTSDKKVRDFDMDACAA